MYEEPDNEDEIDEIEDFYQYIIDNNYSEFRKFTINGYINYETSVNHERVIALFHACNYNGSNGKSNLKILKTLLNLNPDSERIHYLNLRDIMLLCIIM